MKESSGEAAKTSNVCERQVEIVVASTWLEFLQGSLERITWSEKDNKEARAGTIWSNRRQDGKHQQGVRIVMEGQTEKH